MLACVALVALSTFTATPEPHAEDQTVEAAPTHSEAERASFEPASWPAIAGGVVGAAVGIGAGVTWSVLFPASIDFDGEPTVTTALVSPVAAALNASALSTATGLVGASAGWLLGAIVGYAAPSDRLQE